MRAAAAGRLDTLNETRGNLFASLHRGANQRFEQVTGELHTGQGEWQSGLCSPPVAEHNILSFISVKITTAYVFFPH